MMSIYDSLLLWCKIRFHLPKSNDLKPKRIELGILKLMANISEHEYIEFTAVWMVEHITLDNIGRFSISIKIYETR